MSGRASEERRVVLCRSFRPRGRKASPCCRDRGKTRGRSRSSSALPSSIPTSAASLPEEVAAPVVPPPPGQIEPQAEALIAATGADFRIGSTACLLQYNRRFRTGARRRRLHFEPINWHRTAFHELSHWSGAASRLGRDLSSSLGSKSYARESWWPKWRARQLRLAWRCADRAPCRLHRLVAGSVARGRPRRRAGGERGIESCRFPARLSATRDPVHQRERREGRVMNSSGVSAHVRGSASRVSEG